MPADFAKEGPNRLVVLGGVVAAGLLLRAVYLLQIPRTPLADLVFLDALSYHNWARRLAAGDWVGREPFHMAPLYPYLLGVVYRAFGEGIAPKIVQSALGVANGLLIFLLAERIFGRTTALIAFFLSLLYGPFLFYEIQLLNTTLALTLALSTVLVLDWAIADRRHGLALFAGILLGLGCLVRPEFLLFAPLAIGAIALTEWRGGIAAGGVAEHAAARAAGRATARAPAAPDGRSAAARLLLFAAGAALPLAISGARNALVSGDFVLVSHHGGISFYMGNNEYTDGTYRPPPFFQGTPEAIDQRDSRRFAEMEAGRPLAASEVDRFWFAKSLAYIREHPAAYARLLARKLALYWGDYEIPLNASWDFFRRYSPTLVGAALPFGLIVPLAVIGAGAAAAARDRRALLPALFVLANMAAVVAFFVCDRYRQPAVPFLLMFAAAGLARIAGLARDAVTRAASAAGRADPETPARASARPPALSLALSLALVVALAALLHIRISGNPSLSFARSHVAVGQAALRRGDRAAAERAFRDAVRENPLYIDASMNLGALCQEEKRYAEAAAAYESVLRINPHFAGAHLNLGACAQEQGRFDEAVAHYERAEAADPFLPAAPNNLGTALQALGRGVEAEAAFRRSIALDPAFLDARANLARLFESERRLDEAAAAYREILARIGSGGAAGSIEARLGDVLAAGGRFADAEPHYRRALASAPPTPERVVNLGVALANLGRRDEALALFDRAAREFPDAPDAALHLANLQLETGDAARARATSDAAARRFPRDPRFPYASATAAAASGDAAGARNALDEAIRRGGDPVRAAALRDPRLAGAIGPGR